MKRFHVHVSVEDLDASIRFYATVFGTQTCLDVLALAIDKLDTPLVRDAIAALSKSTVGANLFSRGKGRQPLLDALAYPERRVQYEAALTLGHASTDCTDPTGSSSSPVLGLSGSYARAAALGGALDGSETRAMRIVRVWRPST